MYTLKSITKRGALLGAAGALLVAAVLPGAAAFADSLNPLTDRSLMLSSSAPGHVDTDGSGNSFGTPNPAASTGLNPGDAGYVAGTYAPAGTGPNGKKTGETLSFKVSTNATIKAFALQYCTTAAGNCRAPGNNTGDFSPDRPDTLGGGDRQLNATANTGGWANGTSDLDVTGTFSQATAAIAAGQFQVYVDGVATTATDWTMTAVNNESKDYDGSLGDPIYDSLTGTKNYLVLKSATGQFIGSNKEVKIVFKPSETIFITNPGAGAFFVKMNTYNSNNDIDIVPGSAANVDGGVTVANVMTDSIHITTKVLETMAFSVGTRNRDNVVLNCAGYPTPATIAAGCEADTGGGKVHGTCDAVQNVNNNRLNLGNPDAEYSLETGKGWSVASYWRLSSNSSGGATVYYSGNTLTNTVGDSIKDMLTEDASTPGTEQFGLGFIDPAIKSDDGVATGVPANDDPRAADFAGNASSSAPFLTLAIGQTNPALFPANQGAAADYDQAAGTLNNGTGSGSAKFKFLATSNEIPEVIAKQNSSVISCATAKMRYVGNIAADTPAGVYTTKINYLAAPQY